MWKDRPATRACSCPRLGVHPPSIWNALHPNLYVGVLPFTLLAPDETSLLLASLPQFGLGLGPMG